MSLAASKLLKKQQAKTKRVLSQADRDAEGRKAILADLFEQQRNFVLDKYRRKTLLCPRRAGKTHSCIAHALVTALEYPDCTVVIVTTSLKKATQLYWKPFRQFSDKYQLNLDLKAGDKTVYLPNGSQIWLTGCDSLADVEKVRGEAIKLIIVDECKSIREELMEELIFEAAMPATDDTTGTIVLIGTPGKFLMGLFYEATCPGWRDEDGDLRTVDYYNPEPFWDNPPTREGHKLIPQWRRHHWTVAENVFRPDIWRNAIQRKIASKWSDDNPIWIRENLGRWASTIDTMVYALSDLVGRDGGAENCRCTWRPKDLAGKRQVNKHGLPNNMYGADDWVYILGMDLGFEDDTAFVVAAYSPTNHTMYQVYEEKHPHLIVEQVARIIGRIMSQFDNRIAHMVADGQNKQLVESINQMYGYFIEPANKTDKFDFIELLNSDLHEGRLKILRHGELYGEWMRLQWDFRGKNRKTAVRTGRIREDYRIDNHLSDAMLYTWRFSYHHFSRDLEPKLEPESDEWHNAWDDLEHLEAMKARQQGLGPVDAPEAPWTQQYFDSDDPLGIQALDATPFDRLLF